MSIRLQLKDTGQDLDMSLKNIRSQIDNKSIGSQLDAYEYWLNYPEDWNRPKQAQGCTQKEKDQKILDRFFTKRLIRLARLSNVSGIRYEDYKELCNLDQKQVQLWYWNDVFSDHPEYEVDANIFELQIEESSLADQTSAASQLYYQSLEDFHNNPPTTITTRILESQRKHYRNTENKWHDCLSRLNEKLKEKIITDKEEYGIE